VLEDLTAGGDGMGGIINTPADLNGQIISVNGNGFTVSDAYNGSTFNIKHSNGTLNICECIINKTVTTTSSNRYLLFFRDYGTGDTNFYNNRYNMNNSLFGVARLHQHQTGTVNLYANIFEDSTITATDCINSSSGGDGTYNVVNNNFINVVDVAHGDAGGAQIAFKNNYLDYSGTGLTGNVLDDGGNVTSGTTSLGDAFEDLIDYVPKSALKVGVNPSLVGFNQYANGVNISSPYYVGANGVENENSSLFVGSKSSRRKKIVNYWVQKNNL
jgi:hypothetical protein